MLKGIVYPGEMKRRTDITQRVGMAWRLIRLDLTWLIVSLLVEIVNPEGRIRARGNGGSVR